MSTIAKRDQIQTDNDDDIYEYEYSLVKDGDSEEIEDTKVVEKLNGHEKFMIIGYSFMSGVLHLIWYNTVLNIAFPLRHAVEHLKPGGTTQVEYNPTPIWLPMGSAGSICGNLLFLFKNEPSQSHYLWYCAGNIFVMGLLIILFHWLVYEDYLSEGVTTPCVGIFLLLSEVTRGYLQSTNFGLGPFYEAYGIAKYMSVAASAGEGVSGLVPWITILVFTSAGDADPTKKYNLVSVETAYLVALVIVVIYVIAFGVTFYTKAGANLKAIWIEQTENRKQMRLKQEENERVLGLKSNKLLKYKMAVNGTKLTGFGIFLTMLGTLNVYPQCFPFGVSNDGTNNSILLGIFTVLDPVFRLLGFVLPSLMRGWVPPKMLYVGMVIVKTAIFNPLLLYGFFKPYSSLFNTLGKQIALIIGLGVCQGSLTIFGVFTYMSHLKQNQYTELSASLFVIYLIIGVLIGQATFNIYPAIQPSPLIKS